MGDETVVSPQATESLPGAGRPERSEHRDAYGANQPKALPKSLSKEFREPGPRTKRQRMGGFEASLSWKKSSSALSK